jgi:hypothetical protein
MIICLATFLKILADYLGNKKIKLQVTRKWWWLEELRQERKEDIEVRRWNNKDNGKDNRDEMYLLCL